MFKRLTKARRHSADELGTSLSPTALEEPPGVVVVPPNQGLDAGSIHQTFNPAILRSSRFKYARRSCSDAVAMEAILNEEPSIAEHVGVNNDYQTVTAVPAFIVEHESEKIRGK